MRVVESGLRADADGEFRSAQSRYERAIQVDAYNPYAYLALARFAIQRGDLAAANNHLERASHLFHSEIEERRASGDGETAELLALFRVHLKGLRGALLAISGRNFDAEPLLEQANRMAPTVWGDGSLSASELR